MRLNEIQEQFKDLMLDDPALLEAVPDDFASVFEEGDIALAERLKVYRSNIVGGITDNFAKTFPLLDKLVGEDFLKQMVRAFVMKHPPSAGCLNHYGEEFPDFIRNYEPAQELPYLPDMAALELALNTAYNAPDDEALSADSLSALAPEALGDVVLLLRSSAILVSSCYALDALRAYCLSPEGEPPYLLQNCYLLVYRPKLAVEIVPLSVGEFSLLESLSRGRALGEAVAKVLERDGTFDFGLFLQKHLALETFQALPPNVLE
jgi:hypothetical protein